MHEEPQVPNYGPAGQGSGAEEGHGAGAGADGHGGRLAHEAARRQLDRVTADGSLAAHFEHTVAVTDDGPVVLTV